MSSEERERAGEMNALRKEILETRNLIIKTDNLLRTFHTELKDIGKKHDHTAKAHKLSNVGAYAALAVLGITFAFAYGAVIRGASQRDSHKLLEQAQKTQEEADQALASAKQQAAAAEQQNTEAVKVWELVTSNDETKQDEGLVRAAKLDPTKLTAFARAAIERTAGEMRESRAEKAFAAGMSEQHRGNPRGARDAFERFLAIAGQMPAHWKGSERLQAEYQLGALYNQLGDHDKAVPYLRKYIDEGDSSSAKAYAYLLMGDSLEATKKTVEAQEAFRKGLELGPSGVTASLLRRRIGSDPT